MSALASVKHEIRLFCVAVQFLSRVPIPARITTPFDARWLNDCVRWFPLVGALVGAVGAVVLVAASHWWPAPIAALLALSTTLALTGAFHEDGFADTFDALGGTVSRTRALEIMKDSRIGTYGSAALWFSLTTRAAALATLTAQGLPAAVVALVSAHLAGRMAAVAVMAALPYAGDVDHAKAKPLAMAVARRNVAVAALMSVFLAVVVFVAGSVAAGHAGTQASTTSLSPGHCLFALSAAGLVTVAMVRWLRRRLGGYTGDALGATEQFTEITILVVMAGG